MCGKCKDSNEINSTRLTLVVLVLFSVTLSALGISCFALLTVQKLSKDLNSLRLVLSRTRVEPAKASAYGFINNIDNQDELAPRPMYGPQLEGTTENIHNQVRFKRGLDSEQQADDDSILEKSTLVTSTVISAPSSDPIILSLAAEGNGAPSFSNVNRKQDIRSGNSEVDLVTEIPSNERERFETNQKLLSKKNETSISLPRISNIHLIKEEAQNQLDHNVKKKAVNYEDVESFTPEYSVPRNVYRHRQRGRNGNQLEIIDEFSPQAGRLKSLTAIHLNGDTSQYTLGVHTNYKGNGHLRHPQKTFVDWKMNDWVETISATNSFHLKNGVVTVEESGLYFIYAQIYYLDEHDSNGFMVRRNSENILHCKVTAPSSERLMKGNTCYTGAVVYLDTNDRISLDDISDGRYTLFIPGYSFFGMIKIGDIKGK